MTDEIKIKREDLIKVFEYEKTAFKLYELSDKPGEELHREKWLSEWCGVYHTILTLGLKDEFDEWETEKIREEICNG